jgi:alpha,alpha-trehalase
MYGWDSFFIQMGLLRDGQYELARDIADNFLYEVESYGKVLNANRTYYLIRSQPPFLTQMILAVYRRTHDRDWLASAVPRIEKYYEYWLTKPHLTRETGLSRYFDLGDGPAPEVLSSEVDSQGRTDYDLIGQYFHEHRVTDYDVNLYYDSASGKLTGLFYKGDRSMRESGFDPSNRFGPFSVDIIHYNPVCLNVLLYLMESQTAEILETLHQPHEAEKWRKHAEARAVTINRLMWDEAHGLYFDYHFEHKHRRVYPFLTAFYPLWAGIATSEQAGRVVRNLSLFESQGGLRTSTRHTGDQWDSPYGWAPLQWIAVEGMRRYGFQTEADRVARKFLELLIHDYQAHATLVEKYDVVRDKSDISRGLKFGYHSNEAGFGWTNAVFTALLDGLAERERHAVFDRMEVRAGSAPQP